MRPEEQQRHRWSSLFRAMGCWCTRNDVPQRKGGDRENIRVSPGGATQRKEYPRNVLAPSQGIFVKRLGIEQCPIKVRCKCD
jgi:hypothetical protein